MSQDFVHRRQQAILESLSRLPEYLIKHHEEQRLADLVLHHMCKDDCFGLQKAAYLVNNPDFACLKGVSGWHREDMPVDSCAWAGQDIVLSHLERSSFHKNIQNIQACALDHKVDDNELQDLAREIGFENPRYIIFPIKHGNEGIFLYEKMHTDAHELTSVITRGACYLGLCPVV